MMLLPVVMYVGAKENRSICVVPVLFLMTIVMAMATWIG
jgi:hypothetical protein